MTGQIAAEKLAVFISYSRDDLAFCDQLVVTLEFAGFDPRIDRHGIHGAENWELKLGTLTRVLTASYDGTARVWDAATGREIARLQGHGDWVLSAAFSPDGTRIVTASRDRTARVWDAATGNEVARLTGHGDTVQSAAFSPNGGTILTASNDGTARIWRVSATTQDLVDTAKSRLNAIGRCLTPAQRRTYFLPEAPPLWCVERRLWPYQSDEWQEWLANQKAWLASGSQGPAPARPKAE
jgi:dipeptidyl aminopeptidase/acylaminoacyl peptidase